MGKHKLKPQSRRDFLKTLGLTTAMMSPLLRSQVAMGQTARAPMRLLIVPLGHGWGMDSKVTPSLGSEFNFTLPPSLSALNSVKDQVVLIDSVRTGSWGNAHITGFAEMLTCSLAGDEPTSAALGGGYHAPLGASIDWMLGNHLNKGVLRLANDFPFPICFDSNTRNLPFYNNAYDAYMGVINPLKSTVQTCGAGTNPTPTPAPTPGPSGPSAASVADQAVFKMWQKDADSLKGRLSGAPKTRMESYIIALTDLARSLGLAPSSPAATPTPVPTPVPNNICLPGMPPGNLTFGDQIDQYLEMIRACFLLDTHRVAVLALGEGASNWTWRNEAGQTQTGDIFGNDFHQDCAHYDDKGIDNRHSMEGWNNWYAQKIANFVNRLKSTVDVDGRPMIDNTLILLTGEVGNGVHNREMFGQILLGGGAAGVRRNRYIKLPTFDSRVPGHDFWATQNRNGSVVPVDINYIPTIARHHASDMWVSIARLMGMPINKFGFDIYNYQPIQLT